MVTMSVTRPLDCGGDKSYVIPLDKSFDVINAWLTTTYEVKFHGDDNFKTGDTFYLGEDGSCVVPPTPDPCTLSFNDG